MIRYIAGSLCLTCGVWAQTGASDQDLYAEFYNDTLKKPGGFLQEIVVNQPNKPPQVSRAAIKPLDLPQSIQVFSSDLINQQQAVRLSEVVRNANGVYVSSARGGAQESLFSRGYDMSANNMFKNGFRMNSGSMPEVSSLERVEVLKGSAALLYGNVAPGGILNMVTKTPKFTRGGEISMQAGSYSFYRPSIDVYGPLSSSIAYRFAGSYENSESFRDVVKNERIYVNPSLAFKMSPKTNLVLQADYLNADWTPDFGTAIIGKEIVDLPRSLYMGARWSNGNTVQSSVSLLLDHEFNSNWKINFNSSFQDFDRRWKGTERIQPAANGDWSRPLAQVKNTEQILGQQLSLQGIFKTGSIRHQIFTGVDYENSFTEANTYSFSPNTYGSGNIFDFENFDQGSGIPQGTLTRIVKTDTDRFGVYFQDLISFTEKWKVLAGLRWSWQEASPTTYNVTDNTSAPGAKRIDKAFTPKVGLVFQPTNSLSFFTSYANSFTPNTGVTVDGEPLEASLIDQLEAGVKKEWYAGRLTTNLTVYRIVNSNLSQTAEFRADGTPNTDTNIRVLSGETTSNGVEIDIMGSPVDGLTLAAGYSYNDMRYTKTAKTNGSFIEGDRVVRTPAHTANASFFYTLQQGKLKGLQVGALANYIGDRLGGWNNNLVVNPTTGAATINDREVPLDGYVTLDLSAGYSWKKFSILCKVSNVTNTLNYVVHENYSVNPLAPTQFLANLTYRFQ